MKRLSLWICLAMLVALAAVPLQASAYSPGEEVPLNFPRTYLPFDAPGVAFEKTGGEVLVSNAPETINEDGALRADGSVITGQYNATLYRDTVTGPFRFWGSHYNKTNQPLKFWIHVANPSAQAVKFYITREAYADAAVTTAASEVTRSFMDAEPDKRLLAAIPAGGSYSFAYSDADHVAVGESVVYFAEFSAENAADGQDAGVLVSHVVTTADKTDPAPYAATPTIARTNATADRSDDYRGVLDHWGRTGTIDLTLTNDNPFLGLRLGDQGYSGEQEKLYTRWNVKGEPVEKQEVRFVTPTINKVRLAYWYIDYDVQVHLKNQTGYPVIHTLYGSNGTNPGFVNYQLNDGPANNYHFARNTVVPVTTEKEYRLRMMVMPSAYLPYGLYFAAGTPDGVPNELVVSKAEYSLLAADAGQAEELVNKLPEGPEKAALTARLAQVREWISAEAAVSAAESRLQELEALLQTVDLTPTGKAQRDSLRQQLVDGAALVQEALTAAAAKVEALPPTDSSALKEHLADFRSRLAAAEGRLEAVQAIADQALQPGNRFGDADLSLHKKAGETASLNELTAEQAQPLPVQGPFTWVGSDTAVATVTPDGVLTAVREGSALVYGYNGQGLVAVLVHVGD